MGEVNNEFTEDVEGTHTRLNKVRIFLYVVITSLLVSVMILYSAEGIHAAPGQYKWVLIFFGS